MTAKLLSAQRFYQQPKLQNSLSTSVTQAGLAGQGFRTQDLDAWGRLFSQIKEIEATHQKYNDIETPLIPTDIIQGARRLIRELENQGNPPPTCMTGTVDATICFEWHEPTGGERFISIDVIGIDQYEIFIRYRDKPSMLEVVPF